MTLEGAQSRVARPWRGLRRLSIRTPLRTKLITALAMLVILALAAISAAGIMILRSYLLGQADNSLPGYQGSAQHELGIVLATNQAATAENNVTVYLLPAGGHIVGIVTPGASPGSNGSLPSSSPLSPPVLSGAASWLAAHLEQATTVPAQSGSGRWRAMGFPIQYTNFQGTTVNGTLIIAVDVTQVYNTIRQLTVVDLVVSIVILFVLLIVGFVVVRTNLRPLVDIEETAGEIAAGHLNRRVPERDPRTEVGSLGRSLNIMLSQIETAFHAREESEAAAHQSEERMRRFIADASHELRTPLTAIRGFAEYYRQRGGIVRQQDKHEAATSGAARAVLGAGLTPEDLDRIMQRVESEAARMGLLVEDLLLLARLDQQRPLSRQPIDLLSLAADAVHDTRMLAPDRTIGLSVQPGAAFLVTGDEPRLRQVIGNLMSNALTHTPDGTPIEVSISSGILDPRAADPAPAVIIDVTDHGPGMTPEQAHRVFERFYRADQARTRTKGGSGLGLAIVSALVAAHGGVASVRTAPDRGATFRVTLPLSPEAQGSLSVDDDADEFGQAEMFEAVDEAGDVSVTYGTAISSGARKTDENDSGGPGGSGAVDGSGGSESSEGSGSRRDAAFTGLPRGTGLGVFQDYLPSVNGVQPGQAAMHCSRAATGAPQLSAGPLGRWAAGPLGPLDSGSCGTKHHVRGL
jgi:two-component system, OmpR family, sensor kinase